MPPVPGRVQIVTAEEMTRHHASRARDDVGGAVVVFRCPKDRFGWFEKEGSSYEWNYQANGQPIVLPGVISGIQMTAEKARLMYDYENFHPGSTNGTKNVLHGDGHVAPIR